jgi:hypothetical protein
MVMITKIRIGEHAVQTLGPVNELIFVNTAFAFRNSTRTMLKGPVLGPIRP